MLRIQFPQHNFRIKEEDNREFIFDEGRRKWVRLTPEEWVRQNFLQYLIQVKKIPLSIIAIEKEVQLADVKKRCDVIVYKEHKPWMIVECKEMNVPLSQAVLEQVIRYNMALPVEYLVISNGSFSYAWQRKNNNLIEIEELPMWR
ncbi:MAG: type I restriction enzyme HsdR N-terminal domain-containing protein [Ilyomonas sp.]